MSDEDINLNELENPFEKLADAEKAGNLRQVVKKRGRGRPPKKKPVQESAHTPKPPVGETQRRRPVGLRGVDRTPTRKGYVRYWANLVEDNIDVFKEGGWTQVLDDDGEPKTRKSRAGRGPRAMLMEIPEELYNEDQTEKTQRYEESVSDLLKSRADAPGFYQPRSKRNVEK